jgi:hypothetical protein
MSTKAEGWLIFSTRWLTWLVLGPIWFFSSLLGWGLIVGLFTRNWFPENAILFNKLAYEVGGVGVLVLIGVGLISAAWLTRGAMLKIRQRRNDSIAAAIMQSLRTDPGTPRGDFFLYLRAFETTGRLNIPLYLHLQQFGASAGRLLTNDVESYVSSAIRRVAPLIALGRPGEADGAGRILSKDERWMADVLLLLKRCKAILVMPSHRPGTLWEIEAIKREGLLSKCVFMMPPRSKKGGLDTHERWESARRGMAELGLEAPEYEDSGMLFVLAPNGKVAEVEPILLGSKRQIRKSLRRLLDDKPPEGGLFAAITRADRRRRRAAWFGWLEVARFWSPYVLAATSVFLPSAPVTPTNESWGLTFDRSSALKTISDYQLEETITLARSEKYRSWTDSLPAETLEDAKAQLLVRGLFRLKDDDLRDFYGALGEMLDRLDTKTCAAFTAGTMDAGALSNAFTYMPPARISQFLRTRTDALLAELEDRPVPAIDERAIQEASELFVAALTPPELERWQRLNQVQGTLSEEDSCWFIRTLYGGVKRLDAAHAGAWARWLAALPLVEEQAQ